MSDLGIERGRLPQLSIELANQIGGFVGIVCRWCCLAFDVASGGEVVLLTSDVIDGGAVAKVGNIDVCEFSRFVEVIGCSRPFYFPTSYHEPTLCEIIREFRPRWNTPKVNRVVFTAAGQYLPIWTEIYAPNGGTMA